MSNVCNRCGRSLEEGETCTCLTETTTETITETSPSSPIDEPVPPQPASDSVCEEPVLEDSAPKAGPIPAAFAGVDTEAAREAANKAIHQFKDRNGLGIDRSKDVYERGKPIIPDCVQPEPGEFPVHQFTIATLKSRFLGFTYSKAIGRLAITNKRVIFRAAGRSLLGTNLVQQEFQLDQIGGAEARNEYSFRWADMIAALLLCGIGALLVNASLGFADITTRILLGLVLGAAGSIPFLLMQKHWKLKLFCLGISLAGFTAPQMVAVPLILLNKTLESTQTNGFQNFMIGLMTLFALVVVIMIFLAAIPYSLRPNLVLIFRTKTGESCVAVCRSAHGLFHPSLNGCGFGEVLPTSEVDAAVRELGALIASQKV